MAQDTDPVGERVCRQPWRDLVETSLDCPRFAPEISGKRLELLKEIVPKLSRVAVFGSSTEPGQRTSVKRDGTGRRGRSRVQLQYLDVLGPKDIETAFRAASKGRADAVLVLDELRRSILSEHRLQTSR